MIRPSITQAIIDANYPELFQDDCVIETTNDGEGIPYYNAPESESDVEMERR